MHVPLLSRAIACLLLVCLPVQAMAIASARALGPAHVHLSMDAHADDGHGQAHGEDDDGGDHDHHHDHHDHPHHHGHGGHHTDGGVGHHVHDPQLPGVVYLDDDDDKRSADAASRLASKRWVIDHESMASALRVESPGIQRLPVALAPAARFGSRVVDPLERPPR